MSQVGTLTLDANEGVFGMSRWFFSLIIAALCIAGATTAAVRAQPYPSPSPAVSPSPTPVTTMQPG